MDWQIVGETAETVLRIVGNVRRIRTITVMCSIDLEANVLLQIS
jgi:hypothetical protein